MNSLEEAKRRWKRLGDEVFGRIGMSMGEASTFHCSYTALTRRKKSGEIRLLHVPNDDLREVQRSLLRNVFRLLPVHRAAKGFVRNRSIVHHAFSHTGKSYVLVCDIADFFPSTSAQRIHDFLVNDLGWSYSVSKEVVRLVCLPKKRCLPQGAPTSPILANIVNRRMDARLAAFARKHHLDYSRYADDLAFSPKQQSGADAKPRYVQRVVAKILCNFGYELRPDKCRILRRHTRQVVTGLVVNDKCSLPRQVRRRLRAAEHRFKVGRRLSSPAHAGEEVEIPEEALHAWKAYRQMVLSQHTRETARRQAREERRRQAKDRKKGAKPKPTSIAEIKAAFEEMLRASDDEPVWEQQQQSPVVDNSDNRPEGKLDIPNTSPDETGDGESGFGTMDFDPSIL